MSKFFALCLVLLIISGTFGQEIPQRDRDYARQQANALLSQLALEIKEIDEAAPRARLRLEVITYLWRSVVDSNARQQAEALAEAGFEDLEAHKADMPTSEAAWLRRDYLAQMRLNAPNLAARLLKKYGERDTTAQDELGMALSMTADKESIDAALNAVQRAFSSGKDPGMTFPFILYRLQQSRPAEVAGLLAKLLSIEDQKPGSLSFETLASVNGFCLMEEMPAGLKMRYLSIIVKATRESFAWSEPQRVTQAYDLLWGVLPVIKELIPSLYGQALAQASVLVPKIPGHVQLSEVGRRIRGSANPLEQLLTEANSSENKAIRTDLLIEAAQLALQQNNLERTFDILGQIDIDEQNRSQNLWRDQFLNDMVAAAIGKKDLASATRAASMIKKPLQCVIAAQAIASCYQEAQDITSTRQVLNDAVKLVAASETETDKAVAYFKLAKSFIKGDDIRVSEMTLAAIKVTNDLPKPKPDDKPGSNARNHYADALARIALSATPVFQYVAQKDEVSARGLISEIHPKAIKVWALLGIYQGLTTASSSNLATK